jgi:hypothetical protein
MPTFMCFLNWTDQGAKNAKDANKRYQASRSMAEKLGGKLLSAYVTNRSVRRCPDLGNAQWRGDGKVSERDLWLG